MELFKNIFFNTDKVVENTDVKVTYAGKLFQNGSEDVIVHYGFGEKWENAQDVVMQKSELGFQIDIHVVPNTKLNFCFRNSIGEWDNNNGANYAFKIEKEGYNTVNNITTGCINECITGCDCNTVENITTGVAENQSLVKTTSTWGELFKKTFNNFINYFSKLFGTNKQEVDIDNK